MAFCKFCGRQLTEGEVCNCQNQQLNQFNNMNSGFNTQFEPNNQNYNAGDIPVEPNKKKTTNIMIISAGVLLAILFIIVFVLILGNAYKKPFNKLIRGINKNNAELILEQLLTDDMMDDFMDEIEDMDKDESREDFFDDSEEAMEEMKEYLEDDYGKNVKFSVKFISKKDAKKREIKNIERLYNLEDYDVEIKNAYKVKVELRVKGREDDEDMKMNLYSVNIKGEGWKVMVDDEAIDDIRYDIEDIMDTSIYEDIIDDIF